jgi:hypothetical protein
MKHFLETGQSLGKRAAFYILSTVLIVTLLFTTYFGLIQFFYCSFLVLLSYIVNILTYIAASLFIHLAKGIIWCFYEIPAIELLLSINLKLLASFFSRIWKTLSYQGISVYIDSQFRDTKCDRRVILLKFVVIVTFIVILAILLLTNLFKGDASQVSFLSFVIGIIALIGPVLGFFKQLSIPYRLLLYNFDSGEQRSQSAPIHDEAMSPEDSLAQVPPPDVVVDAKSSATDDDIDEQSISWVDPCGILAIEEWQKFMHSNCNVFYQMTECHFERDFIPFAIAVLLGLSYIVLDIIISVQSDSNKWSLVIRVLFNLYALPFCAISNAAVLILKWRALSPHPFVRRVKITVAVLIGISFLIFAGFAIFIVVFFSPVVIAKLSISSPTGVAITTSPPAAICNVAIGDWSLSELAAVVASAQSVEFPNVVSQILSSVVPGASATPVTDNANLPSLIVAKDGTNQTVLGLQGIAIPYHMGVVLETALVFWYSTLMGFIIPFFAIVNQFFLAPILNAYSMLLSTEALGLVPISRRFFEEALESARHHSPVPLFSGHMSGGIVAKALATEMESYASAFESPAFKYSYIEASTNQTHPSAVYKTINVYSDNSLFSVLEDSVTLNVRLPPAQSVFKPATPYETFCLIIAGCSVTDEFDGICTQLIGAQKFTQFFELWFRPRNVTVG